MTPVDVLARAIAGVAFTPRETLLVANLSNPNNLSLRDLAVSVPNILAPHGERTVRRMMGQRTVLSIQDSSDLRLCGYFDYSLAQYQTR